MSYLQECTLRGNTHTHTLRHIHDPNWYHQSSINIKMTFIFLLLLLLLIIIIIIITILVVIITKSRSVKVHKTNNFSFTQCIVLNPGPTPASHGGNSQLSTTGPRSLLPPSQQESGRLHCRGGTRYRLPCCPCTTLAGCP